METGEAKAGRARRSDTSGREARLAVADIALRLEPLRSKIALIRERARRPMPEEDRRQLIEACTAISGTVLAARSELVAKLMDAPQKVAGHSRVVDVEKALDSLEGAVREAIALLG